jgi:hypothetical protein
MFRVKSNLEVNGTHWGLVFLHGEAFTERVDLARRLRSLGYQVEELAKPTATAPANKADPAAADDTGDGEDVIACPVCGKEIGSKGALTRHMNKEHPERD